MEMDEPGSQTHWTFNSYDEFALPISRALRDLHMNSSCPVTPIGSRTVELHDSLQINANMTRGG